MERKVASYRTLPDDPLHGVMLHSTPSASDRPGIGQFCTPFPLAILQYRARSCIPLPPHEEEQDEYADQAVQSPSVTKRTRQTS